MALFGRNKTVKTDEPVFQETRAASSADRRPNFNDLTVGDVSSGVPRIRVGEMLKSFKRQMIWFIPLLLAGIVVSWYFTKDLKPDYHADGSILVQLGSEYVYDPVGTEQSTGAGLTLTPDHIVLNEIALLKNSETISFVISELERKYGPRFSPDIIQERDKHSRGSTDWNNAVVDLQTEMDRSLGVSARPKSSILVVSYKHEDPEIAKAGLNLVIDAYLDFRRSIFVEGSGEVITERREATEEQLKANQRAISRFLSRSGISDFDSEREGVTNRTEELRETLNTLRADLSENEQALATVENQLRGTPEQIDLQIDDRASQRVAQAELELSQLLVKYLPSSEPVRRKRAEVDELKRLQSSFGGNARGGRRVGPNLVYQELETRRNTLQSTADALREKEITVQRQLDSADSKVRKLQSLSPTYADLIRERDTLDERLKDYTTKEQEALINQQQAQANSENVKVIDRAVHARKGRNMRVLLFALGVIGWGGTLAMIALMRVFLDPALYIGQQVRGRRRADRANDKAQAPVVPVVVKPAEYAPEPTPPIPEPVAASHIPQTWQDDPNAQTYAPPPSAPPVQSAYVEPNAYAVQNAYVGNAAPDFNANPYSQQSVAGYGGGSTQPYIGVVPQSPEG